MKQWTNVTCALVAVTNDNHRVGRPRLQVVQRNLTKTWSVLGWNTHSTLRLVSVTWYKCHGVGLISVKKFQRLSNKGIIKSLNYWPFGCVIHEWSLTSMDSTHKRQHYEKCPDAIMNRFTNLTDSVSTIRSILSNIQASIGISRHVNSIQYKAW